MSAAQVTEAHIALSARITRENGYDPESTWNRPHVLRDAQYIADSEAKACAELRNEIRRMESVIEKHDEILEERDDRVSELRAQVALDEKAKVLMLKGHFRDVDEMTKLRAEVERLKSARYKYATDPEMVFTDDLGWVHEFVIGEFDDLKARAERAEAEVERLKEAHHLADGTANLALDHRDAAEARAERAEAELATERETSRLLKVAMDVRDEGYTQSRRRMSALESEVTAKGQAVRNLAEVISGQDKELERERAKVRVLRAACESICEEWGKNHDAPFLAGSNMEKHATAALAATEDAT